MIDHVVVPGIAGLLVDLAATHLHQHPGRAGVQVTKFSDRCDSLIACTAVFLDVSDGESIDDPVRRIIETDVVGVITPWFSAAAVVNTFMVEPGSMALLTTLF